MICPNCGAALEDGAKFCVICGAKLEAEPAAAAPEVRQEAPAAAQAAVCPKCGAPRQGTESFCMFCGTPLNAQAAAPMPQYAPMPEQQAAQPMETPTIPRPAVAQTFEQQVPQPTAAAPMFQQPAAAVTPNFGPAPANLKEFVTLYGDDSTKKTLKTTGIFIFVLAALNLVFALIGESFPLDAIILAVLGFWFQKTYSPKCGIAMLAYAILSVVLSLIMYGELQGWVILIVGVMAFTATQRAQKAFNAFQNPMQ